MFDDYNFIITVSEMVKSRQAKYLAVVTALTLKQAEEYVQRGWDQFAREEPSVESEQRMMDWIVEQVKADA